AGLCVYPRLSRPLESPNATLRPRQASCASSACFPRIDTATTPERDSWAASPACAGRQLCGEGTLVAEGPEVPVRIEELGHRAPGVLAVGHLDPGFPQLLHPALDVRDMQAKAGRIERFGFPRRVRAATGFDHQIAAAESEAGDFLVFEQILQPEDVPAERHAL